MSSCVLAKGNITSDRVTHWMHQNLELCFNSEKPLKAVKAYNIDMRGADDHLLLTSTTA